MPYVDINVMLDYIEANVIVNLLHEKGVDCFLADKYSATSSLAPAVITARIMVNEKDLAHAKHIIKNFFKTATEETS